MTGVQTCALPIFFNKAGEIDETSNIFANASNKSIKSAQEKDGAAVSTITDAEAKALSDAYIEKNAKFKESDKALGALDDENSYAGKFKKQVDAYNQAASQLVALGVKNDDGLQTIAVDSNINKSAEYLDALASSDSYKKVATAVANDDSYADLAGQFAAAAGKASVDEIKGAITDDKAAGKAVKDAIDEWNTAGDNVATIKDKLAKVASAYADLRTARAGVKDGIVTEGIKADGTAVADEAYDTYKQDENRLDGAKTAYYTQAGPKLLEGKTVGVAASNDTVGTASGENAITITANKEGIGGQISGLNISITDSQGNVKKSANAALDAFEETDRKSVV